MSKDDAVELCRLSIFGKPGFYCWCDWGWVALLETLESHWELKGGWQKHLVDYCYGIKDELRSVT